MSAFEFVLVLDVVHPLDVGPEVAPLGELHAAEGAGVRLLARVPQQVGLETLFLCEAMSALLAGEGPLPSVDPLVPDHLRGLQEALAAELARVARDPIFRLCFRSLFDELKTRFQLLVLNLMLPKFF